MVIFDISQLSEENPWWIEKNKILKDFKLVQINNSKYQWDPNIRHRIKLENDIILTIRGPRQVGKTTIVKLIIKDLLLNKNVKPENIFFWSFERNNAEELNQIIKAYLDWQQSKKGERKYLFLDEICSVADWRKEIIYFANKGLFVDCSIVVTGSHAMDLKHATELMPGRRGGGKEETLDKILLPMKFSEFVQLIQPELKNKLFDLGLIQTSQKQQKLFDLFQGKIDKSIENLLLYKKQLDSLFEIYLLTGGIPSTINEYMSDGNISTRLYNVYLQAILGDLRKYNYKENSFKQIVREIFKILSNPVSWNNFTKNTDIKSHNTIQDYATAMEELYITNLVYRCSIHDKRIHSFMKKIYVLDPFIFHSLHGWSNVKKDYFANAKSNVLNLEVKSKLIESVVYNHLCRFSYNLNPRDLFDPKDQIFYYEAKNKKEVDFVMLYDEKYYPFEVKYQTTINNSDFFCFKSFKKGILVNKDELGAYNNYSKIPVSLFLMLI